jgi:hypothetical protein
MFHYTFGKTAIEQAESELEILRTELKCPAGDWDLLQFLYGNLSILDSKFQLLLLFDVAVLTGSASLLGNALSSNVLPTLPFVMSLAFSILPALIAATAGAKWADQTILEHRLRGETVEYLVQVIAIRDARTKRYNWCMRLSCVAAAVALTLFVYLTAHTGGQLNMLTLSVVKNDIGFFLISDMC